MEPIVGSKVGAQRPCGSRGFQDPLLLTEVRMMNRRGLLAVLASGTVASGVWPLASGAQTGQTSKSGMKGMIGAVEGAVERVL